MYASYGPAAQHLPKMYIYTWVKQNIHSEINYDRKVILKWKYLAIENWKKTVLHIQNGVLYNYIYMYIDMWKML